MTAIHASSEEARLLMGRFLVLALRQPPRVEWIPEMLALLGDLPMEPVNPEMMQGAGLLGAFAREAAQADPQAVAARLRQEFVTLFEGPGAMIAPPWESVYRTEEQLLFGPTTFKVRLYYRRWGLGLPEAGREPEDHITLELEFLNFLLEQGAEHERSAFLREHLLTWVPQFCSLVEDGAESRFYQGVAKLLLGYIKAEAAI